MSGKDGLGYSVLRIWVILLALTAAEVLWGSYLRPPTFPRWILWGGLITFALIKGAYILMYFMHMRYERFIVWSLILPTPFLVAVVLCALMPDVSFKDDLRDHPVGQIVIDDRVVDVLDYQHPPFGHHAEGHGAGANADAEHGTTGH